MKFLNKYFIAGSVQHEDSANAPDDKEKIKSSNEEEKKEVKEEKEKEKKETAFDKALQEWANDNARDIAEDDSTPLRSNL